MYLCIYVSMYLCIYVSMYLCIYVSMCVLTVYTHDIPTLAGVHHVTSPFLTQASSEALTAVAATAPAWCNMCAAEDQAVDFSQLESSVAK